MPNKIFNIQLPASEPALYYLWMNIVRLLVASGTILVISILWAFGYLGFNPYVVFYWVIPLLVASAVFWFFAIKYHFSSKLFLHLQFFADFLLLSIALYYTGEIRGGLFPFIYVMPIISAILFSSRDVMAVIGEAFLFYIATWYLYFTNFGLMIEGQDIEYVLIFMLMSFFIVIQTVFYMSQIKRKESELDKLKDEFLFRSIHDLRAPANVIRVVLEKYQSPEWLSAHPETKEDIMYVRNSAQKILDLIKDSLSAARGFAFEFAVKKERIDAADELKKAVDLLSPEILEKRIRMKEDKPTENLNIWADPGKLNEVFVNIIDNAIKYNKENGEILISYKPESKFLKIIIADTGRGVAPADAPLLFTPYFRGSATKDDKRGTGLGLFIVRQLLAKMGGTIEIASTPNVGTTVVVSLPRAV